MSFPDLTTEQVLLATNTMASNAQYVPAIQAAAASEADLSAERLPPELTAAIDGHVDDQFPGTHKAAYGPHTNSD